jgi:hypothetical protein
MNTIQSENTVVDLWGNQQITIRINPHAYGIDVRAVLYTKGITDSTELKDMVLLSDREYRLDDSAAALRKYKLLVKALAR